MNTYKILLFVSVLALSCSGTNYQSLANAEDNENYEKEIARQQRLDSLHRITIPETVQTNKITDPPKTVSKKVKRVNANN